jgi:Fe-S cluster assembly protein SufD
VNVIATRTPAEAAFNQSLPNRRMEDWRWTDLRQRIDQPYPPRQTVAADPADVTRLRAASPFAEVKAERLVFVDGYFARHLSQRENGAAVPPITSNDPISQLNAAFATSGARLSVAAGQDLVVELVFIATKAAARTIATRNVIDIAAGARLTLIETHLGEGPYLNLSVSEISLGEGAWLQRIKLERDAAAAIHLAHAHITLAANATVRDFTLTSGARLNRQNGTINFTGPGAEATVSGAYLLGGSQHADTRLVVDHQVPHCTSRELFKCVMDAAARGIFQGKVIVRKDAQKTDGKQSSHALLLSETAEFDAKPELEIFADDVVCGHGATSGDLNHDHLFYLTSRGIPPAQARALLVAAFVGEAIDTIDQPEIHAALSAVAEGWLEHGHA